MFVTYKLSIHTRSKIAHRAGGIYVWYVHINPQIAVPFLTWAEVDTVGTFCKLKIILLHLIYDTLLLFKWLFFSVTRWLWWTPEVSWDLKRFSRENPWWLPFYRHYGSVSILQFVDKMSFTWLLETNIQIRCSLFKHTTYIKEIYTVSQKKIQQAPTITDNFWQTASAYFLKSCGCPTFLVRCALWVSQNCTCWQFKR